MRKQLSALTLTLVWAAVTVPFAVNAQSSQPASGARHTSQLDSADRSFLEDAAQSGYAEIDGSKLALQKSKNPDVKAFATQMVKDHTAVGGELATLAKGKGYTPPTEPSVMQKGELKALDVADDSFDGLYVRRIGVAAHEDAVKLFEKASKDAKDPDVKAFAQKNLPALQHHLEMAKTLLASIGKK